MSLKFQDFRDMGYSVTRTKDTSPMEKDWATWLIKRRVWTENEEDIKYSINIYVSDIRLWNIDPNILRNILRENYRTFTIKAQFYRDNFTFDITVSNDKEYSCIEDIELLVDEMWHGLNADYDSYN